ncbi:hypothetical protein Golax_005232, partial [Gossypium laxum]|nr:hypothetical protein [Gossypium laxum]
KVAIPVDNGNFLAWKQHVLWVIKTHWLQSFVDGTVVIPLREVVDGDGVSNENSVYVQYKQQDSMLAAWLLSTVSASLHNQLVRSSGSSFELWKPSCVFLGVIRLLRLCDIECFPEEKQSAILNGLPPEFDHVVSIITTSKIPFNLEGITTVLLDAEARQQGHLS